MRINNIFNIFFLAILFTTALVVTFGCGEQEQVVRQVEPQLQAVHTVNRGEYLKYIASQYNVGWEQVLLANERFLEERYDEVCGRFGESYRDNPRRSGLFCNDRYRRPYANTLMPGWQLVIPSSEVPEAVGQTVFESVHGRVAVVIDDTGSMAGDTEQVSQWYMSAVHEHGRQLVGVCLYADREVRCLKHSGDMEPQTVGDWENTYGALKEADRRFSPETIILVTDEPGDDWPSRDSELASLPPVVAHCVPDMGDYLCSGTLTRLADLTKGRYQTNL